MLNRLLNINQRNFVSFIWCNNNYLLYLLSSIINICVAHKKVYLFTINFSCLLNGDADFIFGSFKSELIECIFGIEGLLTKSSSSYENEINKKRFCFVFLSFMIALFGLLFLILQHKGAASNTSAIKQQRMEESLLVGWM